MEICSVNELLCEGTRCGACLTVAVEDMVLKGSVEENHKLSLLHNGWIIVGLRIPATKGCLWLARDLLLLLFDVPHLKYAIRNGDDVGDQISFH